MFILTDGTIAFGPFKTLEDAEEYRARHYRRFYGYVTMELIAPASDPYKIV